MAASPMDGLFTSAWDELALARRQGCGARGALPCGGCGGGAASDAAAAAAAARAWPTRWGAPAAAAYETALQRPCAGYGTSPRVDWRREEAAAAATAAGFLGERPPCVWSLARAMEGMDLDRGVQCAPQVSFAAAAVAWPLARRNVIRTYALPHTPDGTPLITYDQLRDHEPWDVGPTYASAPYWG